MPQVQEQLLIRLNHKFQDSLALREESLLGRLGANCEQLSVRSIFHAQKILGSLTGSLQNSFRQSFLEVVDEARASGVIEITRQAGTSSRHQRDQKMLLERCRKMPSGPEGIALMQEVGDLLNPSTFLEQRLESKLHYVIVHFMPPFSRELKKRTLREARRPWIAWVQGAWRIQYSEADRPNMDEIFEDDVWQEKLQKMLRLHGSSRRPRGPADRGGPYSRPQTQPERHVTPTIWRSLFRNTTEAAP
jgi:hypothetical protein